MSEKVKWHMKGQYLKNCNCAATCSCDISGIPSPHKECEGMAGMHILEGNFGNINMGGLSWVVTYYWPGPLHEGNGTVQAFISRSATEEQRNALLQILGGQAGNPWFEFLASTVKTMHDPQFVDIRFEFDKDSRKAKVIVPGALETESGPIKLPNVDKEQRYNVRMPGGMEYKEMEVGHAVVLRGTGAIKFDHTRTHSSLAVVEHTNEGLIG
ncbi:MAG: DUF1326 domain-containing protein [Candidatus Aenigmarchaeota archaeon]|nr:DUF1326 domain-containing protein [Candidatus Aenigmarchaeota archaeon]